MPPVQVLGSHFSFHHEIFRFWVKSLAINLQCFINPSDANLIQITAENVEKIVGKWSERILRRDFISWSPIYRPMSVEIPGLGQGITGDTPM
jgi:hypothetical protein